MKWINSLENPFIQEIKKIKKNPFHKTLIEGANLVKTAIEASTVTKDTVYHTIQQILVTEKFIRKEETFFNFIQRKNYPILGISEQIAEKLTDTVTPQGIFAVVFFEIKKLAQVSVKNPQVILILDKIQDPGNLGTIIRVSEALGVDLLILTSGTCNPLSPKALRASAGSIFYLPISKANIKEIEEFLYIHKLTLIITDPKAKNLFFEVDLSQPLAIVFGNEARGVSEELKRISHLSCRIPHLGKSDSLNVAMSASIFLYEILRRRIKDS